MRGEPTLSQKRLRTTGPAISLGSQDLAADLLGFVRSLAWEQGSSLSQSSSEIHFISVVAWCALAWSNPGEELNADTWDSPSSSYSSCGLGLVALQEQVCSLLLSPAEPFEHVLHRGGGVSAPERLWLSSATLPGELPVWTWELTGEGFPWAWRAGRASLPAVAEVI